MQQLRNGLQPYRGLVPFGDNDDDRCLFFGRGRERLQLLNAILAESLTVLFARSGLGKTSLINAALLPALREQGFFPVVVRFNTLGDDGPVGCVFRSIVNKAKVDGVTIRGGENRRSLWEFFASTRFEQDTLVLRPVIIFDPFEELFTLVRLRNPSWETDLIQQIADLVRNRVPEHVTLEVATRVQALPRENEERKHLLETVFGKQGPHVKVLLSLREDYLPELEGLKEQIPAVYRNALRLLALNYEQARAAIVGPSRSPVLRGEEFEFQAEAVEEMLRFLGTSRGSSGPERGGAIDPSQLQLLCNTLDERRRRSNSRRITVADLGGRKGMQRTITSYYHRVLYSLPPMRFGWNARRGRPSAANFIIANFPRLAARQLCELGLITPGGHRNSLEVESIRRRYGVANRDIHRLVEQRLIIREPRLRSFFCELSHDTLVEPLKAERQNIRRVRAVFLSVLLLLIGAATGAVALYQASPQFAPAHDYLVNPEIAADEQAEKNAGLKIIFDTEQSLSLRAVKVRELVGRGYADFSRLSARRIRLDSLMTANAQFVGADLQQMKMRYASVPNTNFYRANLIGADFRWSTLRNSSFVRATLTDANFVASDLVGSKFTGSDLRNANFSASQLQDAIFTDAQINDDTNFGSSVWWLGIGWTPEQVVRLEQLWPHTNFRSTVAYSVGIDTLTQKVESTRGAGGRAAAFSKRAWYRAIRGLDLDLAFQDAERGLRLDPTSFDLLDTRGYIYLQLGMVDQAIADFRAAVTLSDSMSARSAKYHHRLGTALIKSGVREEGARHIAFAEAHGYRPTHELLLAPIPQVGTDSVSVPGATTERPQATSATVSDTPGKVNPPSGSPQGILTAPPSSSAGRPVPD